MRLIIEHKNARALNDKVASSSVYHALSRMSVFYRHQQGIKTSFHLARYIFLARKATSIKKVCIFKGNHSSNVFHAFQYSTDYNQRGLEPRLQIRNDRKNKKTPQCSRLLICYKILVRERGLEPPQPYGHYHLKVARLPIPPLAQATSTKKILRNNTIFGIKTQGQKLPAGSFYVSCLSGRCPHRSWHWIQ